MITKWRVVAIDSSGARIMIDEGLTAERANEIRDLMLQKGPNAIVEAEVPLASNERVEGISDRVPWSTGDPPGSRADISLSERT